ncbi:MAG: hypothetical protein CMC13_08185 [Flavobacteriaceae bacterium]|nr:hypothetical protein [Flavobacteriaceae bacterium]|tara:strand:+ start:343 stop:912 length:570 start_codon:yes stop_codon:yes gene_type:complete
MKFLLSVAFLCFSILGFSQEEACNYKIQVDTDEEVFKLTNEQLTEFLVGKDRNVFIYFSLMRENDVKSLVIQVSVNAKEMPPILCFNKDSRVSFALEDGSFASLRYLGEVTCGRQTENTDTLNNSTSEAAFLLDEVGIERLQQSKIASMRITTMKTNFDVSFQDVLSNDQIPNPIYPKEFFLNNLKCLE